MTLEVEQLGARLLRPLLRSLHEASQQLGLAFEPNVHAEAAAEITRDDEAAVPTATAPARQSGVRSAASQHAAAEPMVAPSNSTGMHVTAPILATAPASTVDPLPRAGSSAQRIAAPSQPATVSLRADIHTAAAGIATAATGAAAINSAQAGHAAPPAAEATAAAGQAAVPVRLNYRSLSFAAIETDWPQVLSPTVLLPGPLVPALPPTGPARLRRLAAPASVPERLNVAQQPPALVTPAWRGKPMQQQPAMPTMAATQPIVIAAPYAGADAPAQPAQRPASQQGVARLRRLNAPASAPTAAEVAQFDTQPAPTQLSRAAHHALRQVGQAVEPVLDRAYAATVGALAEPSAFAGARAANDYPAPQRVNVPVANEAGWQGDDAATPASDGGEAPRVANHFNVNVAMSSGGGALVDDPQALRDALTELLRDAARRQGLDV
ncbi:hypothetical protein [Chitiniphilus eburneus]|uniref:Uncharacterized protein n=1 Tax=Chitiniphilus eburneus TaxID=2571148 RepID=A0A4U0P9L8_9NEIS|nr:hypothetical protein [Chitiniphilus eburneus]TJZ64263.1 hypothetical protein FAZ21_19315 [Chitiniphilus eburneus]